MFEQAAHYTDQAQHNVFEVYDLELGFKEVTWDN